LRRDGARNSDAFFILSQPCSLVKPAARLTAANQLTLRLSYFWNNSTSGGVYFTKPQHEMRREQRAAPKSLRLWVELCTGPLVRCDGCWGSRSSL